MANIRTRVIIKGLGSLPSSIHQEKEREREKENEVLDVPRLLHIPDREKMKKFNYMLLKING